MLLSRNAAEVNTFCTRSEEVPDETPEKSKKYIVMSACNVTLLLCEEGHHYQSISPLDSGKCRRLMVGSYINATTVDDARVGIRR